MALAEATLHNSRRALSTRAGQDGRVIPPLVSSLVSQGCSGKFSKNGDREDNVFVERKPRIEVRLRTFDARPERGYHPILGASAIPQVTCRYPSEFGAPRRESAQHG